MKRCLPIAIFVLLSTCLQAQYLYRTMTVRAAPGEMLNVIEMYKKLEAFYRDAGDEVPFWMRHSQGDQWDILFLYPMGSFAEYYSPERLEGRRRAARRHGVDGDALRREFYSRVGWHEEIYVSGPPLETVRAAFQGAGFFHVEMFRALPGKYEELVEQRKMENRYLAAIDRPENLIFTHEQGAAVDVYTLGCYRDLLHYAESERIPAERKEAAAKAAGFKSAADIGPYLRTLIAGHHDTLAVRIP